MNSLHIGIAGAGLAGRTLAWRLLRAGCRVTLFDSRQRAELDTASMTAAAMLSPLAELSVSDEVVFQLGRRSMELWPRWVAELEASSGESIYFRQKGTLVVAHAPDQSSLDHFSGLLHHRLPEACRAEVHTLDAAALAQREPALAGRFGGGLFLESEGQLANDQWMAALALEIDRLGVTWHEGQAVERVEEGRIICAHETHAVDVAVDARGVGSKAQWPQLRGVRGEVLRVECPGVTLQRPVRLMHPRYALYVAPRPDHQFVVGATELESEDMGPVTLRSTLELGSALYSLHPAFGEARVLRLSAALRPALDDHRPAVALRDGVWHINGLYRHGYLCAPAVVDELAHKLLAI
ncbi:glycine oxidase ThiO [Polaromonas hydrogenivorans]|uniref:Glycine oxidase ThiO n=1 Tax=Polaromonas hydrogenivorans TaxID=335476 RepID=A0AAU7LRM2_9BURK